MVGSISEWIRLFRDIGVKISDSIRGIVGTDKAKSRVGRNKFGDTTVYIDTVADEITKSVLLSVGGCSVLTEESGSIKGDSEFPLVIVDPIDGSLNAKRGIPYYAFSIAVSYGPSTDDIVAGYVIDLSCGREFWAERGKGAFMDGIRIRNKGRDLKVVVVEGLKRETDRETLSSVFSSFYRVRAMGSVALDMCYLAVGAFDVLVHAQPSRIVDYAAGKVILEESGGVMCFPDGGVFKCDISIDKFKPFWCVGNSEIVPKAVRMLEGVL